MLNYTQVLSDFVQDIFKDGKDVRHQSWTKRTEELIEDVVNMSFTLLKPKHYLSKALEDENKNLIKALTDLENAFYCFMPFVLNLWREPKKEEFHFLKTYTGYFTGNIASVLKGSERHILDLLGYEVKTNCENDDEFVINDPKSSQHLTQVAFELFLSQAYYKKVKLLCQDALNSDFDPEMIVELLFENDTSEVIRIGVKELCNNKIKILNELKTEKDIQRDDSNVSPLTSLSAPEFRVTGNDMLFNSLDRKYESMNSRYRLVADPNSIDDDLLYGNATMETSGQPHVISNLSQMKLSSSPQATEVRLAPAYPPPYTGPPPTYAHNFPPLSQHVCNETVGTYPTRSEDVLSNARTNNYVGVTANQSDPYFRSEDTSSNARMNYHADVNANLSDPYFRSNDTSSDARMNPYVDVTRNNSDYVRIDSKLFKYNVSESTTSSTITMATTTAQNHTQFHDNSQSYVESSKSYINKAYNLPSNEKTLQQENKY